MIIEALSGRFVLRQLISSGLECLKEWRERKIERERERERKRARVKTERWREAERKRNKERGREAERKRNKERECRQTENLFRSPKYLTNAGFPQ